ncbi:leucyl aminopeptidase [Candidatus Zixiibacteriota bacterium]
MKTILSRTPATAFQGEALVVGVFESEPADSSRLGNIDAMTDGLLTSALSGEEFSGKKGQSLLLYNPQGLGIRLLTLIGLGSPETVDSETSRILCGTAARLFNSTGITAAAIELPEACCNPGGIRTAVEGFMIGGSGIDAYKTAKKARRRDPYHGRCSTLTLLCQGPITKAMRSSAEAGSTIAEAMILTRRLVNTPGNLMTPVIMASEARRACRAAGVSCTVMNEKQLREAGFRGMLAVNQGSTNPPRLVVMRYRPEGARAAAKPPLALVGKGITFDSGGISIKPSKNMEEMKADMAGAAAVIGAMTAIGRLRPSRPVIGITPLCENMPSGSAIRPGDVINSYNGTTIEVVNTDAEGRLILADALAYAVEQKPEGIVDIATLTGACVMALGHVYAGLASNDAQWSETVLRTAQSSGEKVWPMPMDTEYDKLVESEIADVRNTGKEPPGMITAAKLLEKFVGDTPWVHLDIAGVEWQKESRPWSGPGPTAFGVRLFVDLALR